MNAHTAHHRFRQKKIIRRVPTFQSYIRYTLDHPDVKAAMEYINTVVTHGYDMNHALAILTTAMVQTEQSRNFLNKEVERLRTELLKLKGVK